MADLRIEMPISGKPEIGGRAPQGDGESESLAAAVGKKTKSARFTPRRAIAQKKTAEPEAPPSFAVA
jgi:hypothetical protein